MTTSASRPNPFGARGPLGQGFEDTTIYRLSALAGQSGVALERLPVTIRILLENLLRTADLTPSLVSDEDILSLARWSPAAGGAAHEFPFMPARVLLQDFTGVPAVVDLAAMRDAVKELGGDPDGINPLVPADLVIDHSVQVDAFGTILSFATNVEREYERNAERYTLLRWAQGAFRNFSVVPPGTGIVHQVNLEYLGKVVQTRTGPDGETLAYPDTLVGTDSHTTMINGLGVLGWGVGGIEAEAVMLGQPLYQITPEVVGMRLTGALPEGATATDLVLAVTQMLRKHGVVGRFVEFCGAGLSALSVADRATISNMSPEYGATAALFPVDDATLRYLRDTGRDAALVALVERYTKEQGIFRTDDAPDPQFNSLLELDLATIEPSLAGPRRPQDRVALSGVRENFRTSFQEQIMGTGPDANGKSIGRFENEGGNATETEPEGRNWHPHTANISIQDEEVEIGDGSVVIAAITSCTNTSNPSVMIGAGLLAKHAVERGLKSRPHVKTSLAPGSRVVTDYLNTAELTSYLEALGFHTVGYGCTTCIGNSGPLPEPVAEAVRDNDLVVVSVLSGNRNFEGRIHPQVRASYLASPPLVVAYALAGTTDLDLANDPLGEDPNGQPVYLRDIWPSQREVQETMSRVVKPEIFTKEYAHVFDGDDRWRALPVPEGGLFAWDEASTYVRRPPFFEGMSLEPKPLGAIRGARVLVSVGDSVTTDHISPAGSFSVDSPAGQYLREHGVSVRDFNSYGSRRGNHEVMMRGTFANIRLRNQLAPGKEGYWTEYLPTGEQMTIFDASMRYQAEGTPLLVIAGKEYGSGSSRDWAAKGPMLLGIRATLAESYERIHRSNLVGMGVLPLQFKPGESRESLGLTGRETFDIEGIDVELKPHQEITIRATREDGSTFDFTAIARLDGPVDIEYYRQGGILPAVLRRLVREQQA
ncbi:MAG TPA: aconitate hydratase AcnA [Ktedonobacterales bacterium]|nr:aconitate hydratase AcnA [Ktedonobacterales bacterium]